MNRFFKAIGYGIMQATIVLSAWSVIGLILAVYIAKGF